ncbi:MAG: mechanosensitive ion channel [Robiginitomaculum sp.]|nr:mechanosensitive ion channel [Robiginitomaculum sp.]
MENVLDIFSNEQFSGILAIAVNILKALGIFILGIIISKWAGARVSKRLGNNKGVNVNETLRPFLVTIVKYGILFAALYSALTIAGIPASSLLAVFGAAGLAIALAVQGTLSNVAAGMMLIFLKVIRVGEYIATPSVQGSVLEISLFTTKLRASNGVMITVPNAQIWSSQITNYSRAEERRIDINIELARDNDLDKALADLTKVLQSSSHVIHPEKASIAITATSARSVTLQARAWITTDDVRGHTSDISLALGAIVRAKGYKLPPPPYS